MGATEFCFSYLGLRRNVVSAASPIPESYCGAVSLVSHAAYGKQNHLTEPVYFGSVSFAGFGCGREVFVL